MENTIGRDLSKVYENSSYPETKRKIDGLKDACKNGLIKEDNLIKAIEESIYSLRGSDPHVERYFRKKERIATIGSLSLKEALDAIKKTKVYESLQDFKQHVDGYSNLLVASTPPSAILEGFLNGSKHIDWDETLKGEVSKLQTIYEENRLYILLQNTINAISSSHRSELYSDILEDLNEGFGFPPNALPSYIIGKFKERTDLHPALGKLAAVVLHENLGDTPKKLYYNQNGAIVVTPFSPLHLDKEKGNLILLENRIFRIQGDNVTPLAGNDPSVPKDFLNLCNVFLRLNLSEGKITYQASGGNRFEFSQKEGDTAESKNPIIKLNENIQSVETFDGLAADLSLMGVRAAEIGTIKTVYENFENIALMDNIISVRSKIENGPIYNIIRIGKKIYLNTVNPMVGENELFEGLNTTRLIDLVKESFAIDLSSHFHEGISGERAVAEEIIGFQRGLMEKIQILDVEIRKIDESKEIVRNNPEVKNLRAVLVNQKNQHQKDYSFNQLILDNKEYEKFSRVDEAQKIKYKITATVFGEEAWSFREDLVASILHNVKGSIDTEESDSDGESHYQILTVEATKSDLERDLKKVEKDIDGADWEIDGDEVQVTWAPEPDEDEYDESKKKTNESKYSDAIEKFAKENGLECIERKVQGKSFKVIVASTDDEANSIIEKAGKQKGKNLLSVIENGKKGEKVYIAYSEDMGESKTNENDSCCGVGDKVKILSLDKLGTVNSVDDVDKKVTVLTDDGESVDVGIEDVEKYDDYSDPENNSETKKAHEIIEMVVMGEAKSVIDYLCKKHNLDEKSELISQVKEYSEKSEAGNFDDDLLAKIDSGINGLLSKAA